MGDVGGRGRGRGVVWEGGRVEGGGGVFSMGYFQFINKIFILIWSRASEGDFRGPRGKIALSPHLF